MDFNKFEQEINLKAKLGWGVLFSLSVIFYLVFKSKTLGVFGDALGLLATILFVMGIIDLIRMFFNKNKVK